MSVQGLYSGGKEGASSIEWFAAHDDGDYTALESPPSSRDLVLPLVAAGASLEVRSRVGID